MSRALRVILAAAIAVVVSAAGFAPAHAAGADTLDVQADLSKEGVLTLTQTFTFLDDSDVTTLTQELPARLDRDGQRVTYVIDQVTASVDGTEVAPTVTRESDTVTVSLSLDKAKDVVLRYTVTGTTIATVDDRVDFTWGLVGALNIGVYEVTGRVDLPPGAASYQCFSGVVGALTTCSTYTAGTHGDLGMDLTQSPLSEGQIVQAGVLFSEGFVTVTGTPEPIWSLSRAFTLGGNQLGLTVIALVVGGLLLFTVWRRVNTAGYTGKPVTVAEFVTDGSGHTTFTTDSTARPGMVGTLIDSSVDPADVIATILDLCVRGHLRITELDTPRHAVPDWSFTALSGPDDLNPYERYLMKTLVGENTKVSTLNANMAATITEVQNQVCSQIIDQGWFSRSPGKKSPAVLWGWVGVALAVAVACALTVFTTFAMVGLALIGIAIIGLAITYQARPVTPKGAAVYAGLANVSGQLHEVSPETIDPDRRYEVISSILPYAVVLGGWDRWVAALAAADDDETPDSFDLPWYHAPDDWHMADLPAALDAFITVVTGRLFTRA